MKDERKTEIRVGLMTIAGLIIFFWILGWAKNFSLTPTDRELLIRFPEVSGLEVGDYVTVNGVRKGNVKEIVVQQKDVLVKISLQKEVTLNEDAVFAVMMLDLMGGKKIEIKPGQSGKSLDNYKVQQGQFYADIPSVMSLLGSVQDDLLSSVRELRITLSSMNEYLNDKKMGQNVRSSLEKLNILLVKLNSFIDNNRTNLDEISKNTAELTKNANELISDNKEGIARTFNDTQKLLAGTDSLITTLNTIASETINQKNNFGKLLYDKQFFVKIETTLDQLNELTKLINEQLKSEGLKVDADVDIF